MEVSPAATLTSASSDAAEQLVEWTRAFVPELRAARKEIDETTHTPADIAARMQEAGLWSMVLPEALGGTQAGLSTWKDTVTEIGRGDAGVAWGLTLNSAAAWMAANLYPRHVVDEIFAAKPDARFAGVFSGRAAQARRVEGGLHIDKGMWFFNSGVYQADWNLLGVPRFDEQGNQLIPGDVALVPMSDVKILDVWDPSGLRGSGSTNVTMEDVFIPDERIVSLQACNEGSQPTSFGQADPFYRMAFGPLMVVILAFPVLGLGKHMLESFLENIHKRDIRLTFYMKQHEAPATHLQIGTASAKIDAAEAIIERACQSLQYWADRGETMPKIERARVTRDTAFADKLVWEAVDQLATAAGGSWAIRSNEMNRIWQDAKVAVMHPFVSVDSNLESYGRMLAGIEPDLMAV